LEEFLSGTGNYSNMTYNESVHQYIEDFTWRPLSIRRNHHGIKRYFTQTKTSIVGRTFSRNSMLFPATSNFESVAEQQFVHKTNGFPTSLTGTELLYTAMGSQRAMLGDATVNVLKLKSLDEGFVMQFVDGNSNGGIYKLFKSLGWYSLYPHYNLMAARWLSSVLISTTQAPRLFDGIDSVEDLWMYQMFIKVKPSVVNSEIEMMKDRLAPYCTNIWDYNAFAGKIEDSTTMLNLIFSMNTYMALFLCLFSLIASMSTNIIEQSKEIGIFRSMGLTKFAINKIYVYEALVLILSSSLIGMIIGSVLCFVVLQQQELFTNYPVEFYVPQSVIGACVTGAIGTSILSVWFPLKNLSRKQIAQSMREFGL